MIFVLFTLSWMRSIVHSVAEVSQKCVLSVVLERQLSHRPGNEVFFSFSFFIFFSSSFLLLLDSSVLCFIVLGESLTHWELG